MPLRKILSERQEELPEGALANLLKMLVEEKDIISLGPGEPDFTPPKHIISATKKYLDKGYTHYSPPRGRHELLEAISKKLKKENKIDVNPDQIIVTCGSTEAVTLALMCCIDPGEYVLVPDPGFVMYIPTVELLNGYPISIPLHFENNFQIDPDKLKKLIKEPKKTNALIINTPSNPTGCVYRRKLLEEIADIAIEYDLLILSDEAYEKFVYKGKHISIGSLNGMKKHVITFHTFSKPYGMAGFRVGYAAGPKNIINAMKDIHIYTTICAPTISQMAALSALKGPQTSVKKVVSEYDRRRKFITKRINEIKGFNCIEPEGAFYAFPKYDFKKTSRKLSEWLIKNAKVATVPGSDFGRYGEGFLSLSYATDFKLIKKAMDRIERAVKKLK